MHDRRTARVERRARRPHSRSVLGLAAGLLIASSALADDLSSAGPSSVATDITWTGAFLAGSVARGPAATEDLDVRSMSPVELNVVLEGERGGLPIYCTSGGPFRIRGRAIPERLVLTPREAGLERAEIHWVELRPSADARLWTRERLPEEENRWSLPVVVFSGEDLPPEERQFGTGRFAAAITLPLAGSSSRVLPTSGWEKPVALTNPDERTGFRVTRFFGSSLDEIVLGFARLPVVETALDAHVRNKIALRPVDLVLGAYEQLGSGPPLPGSRDEPIVGAAWAWLFETRYADARRRTSLGAPVVSARARGIPWAVRPDSAEPGVFRGDALVLEGGAYALLSHDDGDGWLDEEDAVVHSAAGEVRRGTLSEVPGKTFVVLRPHAFAQLRADLADAGYGDLGRGLFYAPDLQRACREFQADHQLPPTGQPDDETRRALAEFLTRMRSVDDPGSPDGP